MNTLDYAKRAVVIVICLAVIGIFNSRSIRSQFLDIDDGSGEGGKTVVEEPVKTRSLPPYIVTNVQARPLENVRGAVKITWDKNPESNDSFIVGRALEVPYDAEKALNATSIKLVAPGEEQSAIDSNLPPGQYYYVVLSRSKVMDKAVELHPNVNYTTVPVVIEQESRRREVENLPDKVTLIHAMIVNRTRVLLTWRGIQSPDITYTVYRDTSPLNTPERIRRARRIGTVDALKESYVDRSIDKTGTFFYAVTTKDRAGNEDLQLTPDQSYTATGLFVAVESQSMVSGLRVENLTENSVRLKWNGTDTTRRGSYLVYRDIQPITDPEKIALADHIATIPMNTTEYVDRNLNTGAFYYAVIGKLDNGTVDTALIEDSNYTSRPVVIGSRYRVTGINAVYRDNKVYVIWRYSGSTGSRALKVLRLKRNITNLDDVSDSQIAGRVNILRRKFVDNNPPSGRYYYALVPDNRRQWSRYGLRAGLNITDRAVSARDDTIRDRAGERKGDSRGAQREYRRSGIDSILRVTFFRGRYGLAIKRLHIALSQTDNEYDAAKARLFIGRSLIELGKYRESLQYILNRGVKRHFPRDARFWSSYAISRVR
ncbi:MAG TPA: hypothetical protein PK253_04450 [Spirochaetota bacterium]|nr:hypothetical protein [Spirochaetota bacterium]HPQ52477.1 hypothetical protein [Spirochaetota bacterium]